MIIDSYNGCKLIKEDRVKFYYPDGDEGFIRQMTSIGNSPEEDTTYYQIGDQIGTILKDVFRDYVRSAV